MCRKFQPPKSLPLVLALGISIVACTRASKKSPPPLHKVAPSGVAEAVPDAAPSGAMAHSAAPVVADAGPAKPSAASRSGGSVPKRPRRPRRCPTHKVAFTPKTGCTNDGSVEFCVPKGNRSLARRLKRIAPSLKATRAGGRARCNLRTELLYIFPTRRSDPSVCKRKNGLTAKAWSKICAIASLKPIRRIVPTFYE